MNLRTKMRVGDVTRWHIVRTTRQQTLAEHLYKVWLLTSELHDAIGLPRETKQQALDWALTHDLPEVLVGDLPTPVKRAVEKRAGDTDIWRKLERDMFPDSRQVTVADTPTSNVVKIADCIEGYHFLVVEAVGEHAIDTKDQLLNRSLFVARKAEGLWGDYQWVNGTKEVLYRLANDSIQHCW
jgi:5'-deoxynucleotidase